MADSSAVSKCKLDVNAKDGLGYTLLHKVVMKDNPSNPDSQYSHHRSKPVNRVEEKDVNNLQLLLKSNPDKNIINALTSKGENILHLAIKNERSLEMVKIITKALLDNGVDINLVDKKGHTAFYYAISPISFHYRRRVSYPVKYSDCEFKFTDAAIVQHLMEKGSKIDLVDKNGYSPLLQAAVMQRTDYVKILLENKEKLSEGYLEKTADTFFCQTYREKECKYVEYPPQEYYGLTPLLISICDDNSEMALMLVQAGANVNAVNANIEGHTQYNRMTPLLIAVKNSNLGIAQILVQSGADVNAEKGSTGDGDKCPNMTPLQTAISNNNFKIAELLIKAGANVNTVHEFDGRTPLLLSVYNSNLEIAQILVQAGANVNAIWNKYGNSLQMIIKGNRLHGDCQATEEQAQIAKLLIDSGIDYAPLLQSALDHNQQDIVTYILQKGLDTL